ncbi:adenylate/guanylate cyclase domain-containing protein [Mesorhizobium sp. WSM3859]|uniref:adenylate/guanylate cyclase domain-containing protein n=1 Tax=Mesorhizobium sp. WSM3859 TaxID=2029402 RepID=UPI000BAEE7F5|nr:adenylate/guanylate cyclase domain-containing protein [Mesorhizobium sp. WSM3859]PBC08204.1 adenylate/guanylate cyclase domain-containing protein [Mesorhizobium sp. WSM3859]
MLGGKEDVPEKRRLVAIMAADIVGYSRLVEADEKATLDAIRSLRSEVINPQIVAHDGRIVKLMGDGAIVEFGSVVDAVASAVAIQMGVRARQRDKLPDRRLTLRIGVNLGDVVVEGDDLMGDGVNVAARLEQLCPPGGLLVAAAAYDQLQGKLDVTFDDAGEQQVKNIARPVHVYSARIDGVAHALPRKSRQRRRLLPIGATAVLALLLAAGGTWWFWPTPPADTKPSVAVLPFNNYAGDEATGRLADGLTEDIITDLARYPDFEVVARNSTEVYKGKPIDIREVASALHINYVLEGSIQRQNGRVRITAQLINATSANHLWSDHWDRPDEDVFAVQTEIAQEVSNQLGGGVGLINRAARDAARRKRPGNLTAYELYLLGGEKVEQGNSASLKEAIPLLTRAVELDPGLARAWVSLFFAYNVLAFAGVDQERNWKLAGEAAEHAVSTDPGDAMAHVALGSSFGIQNDLIRAKAEFDTALRLAPSSAEVLIQYSFWAATLGQPKQGGEMADRAIRLDPNYSMAAAGRFSYAYFAADRYEDALSVLDRATLDSYSPDNWVVRPSALAALGRIEEAKRWVKEALSRSADLTIEGWANQPGYSDAERQRFIKTMALAGFPACAKPDVLAKIANPLRLPECANRSPAK